MLSIPEHKTCRNCGSCCGPVPVTVSDIILIKSYLADRDVEIFTGDVLDCPFRNEAKKRCEIYPVRPTVCRLMGVCKGLECKYGNSAFIDGYQYIVGWAVDIIRNINWRK